MAFLIREVDGDLIAYGIELLAGRKPVMDKMVIPAEAEHRIDAVGLCLLHCVRNDLRQELVHVVLRADDRPDHRHGMAGKIMRMAVAAGGHHEPLPGIVQNLCLSFFNEGFCALPAAHIDESAVLDGKRFGKLTVFGSEYPAKDDKVSALPVFHRFLLLE